MTKREKVRIVKRFTAGFCLASVANRYITRGTGQWKEFETSAILREALQPSCTWWPPRKGKRE